MSTHKEKQAPTEWLLDDLLITILDSSPEELVGLHSKLEALAESIQERKSELAPLEPTPPSQIEESLKNMYELGKEYGRTLALKDMEIEKLIKEADSINCRDKADHQGHGAVWWDGHDTAKQEFYNTK